MAGLLYVALAYLLGSIPSAFIVTYLVKGVDIRQLGDGNIGARNTCLHVGWWAGFAVGVLDILKGSVAVLLARRAALNDLAVLAVGAAAVLGHDFMLFLGFQGGQGMATTIGVLLVLLPLPTGVGLLLAALAWIFLGRNWDRSMAIGLGGIPLLAWVTNEPPQHIWYPVALLPIIGIRKLSQPGKRSPTSVPLENDPTLPSEDKDWSRC